MKKILHAVVATVLLCAILLICSACDSLEEIKKKKEKEAKREAIRKAYYDTAVIPAEWL